MPSFKKELTNKYISNSPLTNNLYIKQPTNYTDYSPISHPFLIYKLSPTVLSTFYFIVKMAEMFCGTKLHASFFYHSSNLD